MPASRVIRSIGAVAVAWNAFGVFSYLQHVGVIGTGGPPPGGARMPAAVTGAFAVAVFAGLIGSIGLALLRRWARPVLWLSLGGTLIDWGWVFRYSGAASLPIGTSVVIVAIVLVLLAESAHRRSQLV